MHVVVTRRLKIIALAVLMFAIFLNFLVLGSAAAQSSPSDSLTRIGGIKLSGVYWSEANRNDHLFAPFHRTSSIITTPDHLPEALQAITRQVLSPSADEHIAILYRQFEAVLQTQFRSTLFADVWVVESSCRPEFAVTWIDLWGEADVDSVELLLELPGMAVADVAGGVFASAVHMSDSELHGLSHAGGISWSGWYFRPVDDITLKGDSNPLECAEAASTVASLERGEFAEEAESSPVTIALKADEQTQEGRISFGTVAMVTGKLADVESALTWAHRLADWTHGGSDARAHLQIEPLFEATEVGVGDTLQYGYQLTNLGVAPAFQAALQLPLPSELRYVAGSGAANHGAVSWDEDASLLSWYLGPTLLPGEVATLTIQVIVQ